MRKLISRVTVLSVLSLAVAGGLALPAGASTHPGAHVTFGAVFKSSTPKAKIIGEGSTATFKPTALSIAEDTSGGECGESTPPVSFTLNNTGTSVAYITFDGTDEGGLAASTKYDICIYGGSAGDTATVGLTNKKGTKTYKSTLTLTFTS